MAQNPTEFQVPRTADSVSSDFVQHLDEYSLKITHKAPLLYLAPYVTK